MYLYIFLEALNLVRSRSDSITQDAQMFNAIQYYLRSYLFYTCYEYNVTSFWHIRLYKTI